MAPEGPWKSAVIVLDGTVGVSPHVREVSSRLAAHGHAALALDLFALTPERHENGTMLEGQPSREQLLVWTHAVDAALAYLRAEAPRVPARFGIVGFGVGGFVALVAGYRCQIGAAVSFYGEGPMLLRSDLDIVDGPRRHAASLLCLVGAEDKAVSPDDVAAIRGLLTGYRMQHSFVVYPRTSVDFFRPTATGYRPVVADDAWKRLLHALETAPRPRFRFPRK